jgi:hypothetical protein
MTFLVCVSLPLCLQVPITERCLPLVWVTTARRSDESHTASHACCFQGSGFGVRGSGFRMEGLGLRTRDAEHTEKDLGNQKAGPFAFREMAQAFQPPLLSDQ